MRIAVEAVKQRCYQHHRHYRHGDEEEKEKSLAPPTSSSSKNTTELQQIMMEERPADQKFPVSGAKVPVAHMNNAQDVKLGHTGFSKILRRALLLASVVLLLSQSALSFQHFTNILLHTLASSHHHHEVTLMQGWTSSTETQGGSFAKRSDVSITKEKNLQEWPFPRWADPGGIPLDPLLQFIKGVLRLEASSENRTDKRIQSNQFPDIAYVVDHRGVFVSETMRNRTKPPKFIRFRLKGPERIMIEALSLLKRKEENASVNAAADLAQQDPRWSSLRRAIFGSNVRCGDGFGQGGGFPFLMRFGDNKHCCKNSWNGTTSVPVFTFGSPADCRHAFPFPTYKTIRDSESSSTRWCALFKEYDKRYPWPSKVRQVVWRGSITGPVKDNPSRMGARQVLAEFAAFHANHSLLNIGVTRIPENKRTNFERIHPQAAAMVDTRNRIQESDFQKYVAILDTDGNAWSSRFGTLLCYNSVILKVDAKYVDYFHARDLKPWKHYIPIAKDLSDLIARAEWAIDPANEDAVLTIVGNANEWCRMHMVRSALVEDVLDIWDAYVKELDHNDPNWQQEWTRYKKHQLFAPEFAMFQLGS